MTMSSHHEEVSCMNMHRRRSRQRGLSFYGLVFILVLLLAGVVLGGPAVPAFNDLRSIKSEDLEITEHGGQVVVSFKYERAFALGGPAYLVYRFAAQTH